MHLTAVGLPCCFKKKIDFHAFELWLRKGRELSPVKTKTVKWSTCIGFKKINDWTEHDLIDLHSILPCMMIKSWIRWSCTCKCSPLGCSHLSQNASTADPMRVTWKLCWIYMRPSNIVKSPRSKCSRPESAQCCVSWWQGSVSISPNKEHRPCLLIAIQPQCQVICFCS